MGLRDILTGRHAVSGPAPEKLFAISTAYIALETEHSIQPTGAAAIVFQPLATSDFESTMREMEAVVTATGADSGTTVASQNDAFGYRWMVVRNAPGQPSVEDLAVAINAVSDSIESGGHGERLLCAVFAFQQAPEGAPVGGEPGQAGAAADVPSWASDLSSGALTPGAGRVYFIYNYKRGYWYPFVPAAGDQQRSTERELQLKAQMSGELPIEPELDRWFPLWGIPI
jgi:hypothetical protein